MEVKVVVGVVVVSLSSEKNVVPSAWFSCIGGRDAPGGVMAVSFAVS